MDDFRIAGAVEGLEMAEIQCVEAFGSGFLRCDEVKEIEDGRAPHAARLAFPHRCQHFPRRECHDIHIGENAVIEETGGVGG